MLKSDPHGPRSSRPLLLRREIVWAKPAYRVVAVGISPEQVAQAIARIKQILAEWLGYTSVLFSPSVRPGPLVRTEPYT